MTVEAESLLPATILTDKQRLKQILINLIGNAIKFTHQGGVRLTLRLLPDSESLEFRIIDTGIGIDPEQQIKLFQPFVQADGSCARNHEGSGLGLTISRRLAQLLGTRSS